MKISIIIPTYNRPVFLKRAIDSAINQTYKNIEVIVVSDNDINSIADIETIKLIEEYKSKKNFIYLSAEGNKGGCYARNRGLNASTGEYINFLDDDDVLHLDKIEKQVKKIKDGYPAVVGCYASIFNENGKKYRIEKPDFDKNKILFSELKCNLCTTSINLINGNICKKVGGFTYLESSQEHLFLIKIFSANPTFEFISEELVDIYQHSGPRVSNSKKKPLGALKLTKIIEGYYSKFDFNEVLELKKKRSEIDSEAYCQLKEFDNAKKQIKYRKTLGMDKNYFKIIIKYFLYIMGVKK